MGIIRKVKESDYEFIYNGILKYKPSPLYGLHKYIKNIVMEQELLSTIVYEDDEGKVRSYFIAMLKPASFFKRIKLEMPFIAKIKYYLKNKLADYNTIKNHSVYDNPNMKDNFQNIYNIDGNNIFGCFTYNTCRGELKARELLLYTVKLHSSYKYLVGLVRKDNIYSIKSTKSFWKNIVNFYDIDDKSYLYAVKVDDILSNFKEYTSKHIINIDGGGYRRKLKNYVSVLLNRITGFNSASLCGGCYGYN